jgi:phenylalanyl-tRNA synthetase alpha chain
MKEQLNEIRESAKDAIEKATSLEELKEIQVQYLGKKGKLTQVLRGMGKLSSEERPVIGQLANVIRDELGEAFDSSSIALSGKAMEAKLLQENIDVTLPGRQMNLGSKHPVTLVEERIKEIFGQMGYTVEEGPEVETDYYNFERLNIPKNHPAREMQDTFYISEDIVLRTHTSPVQARVMDELTPHLPVKIIAPGRVFRRDDDATHSPMFHQVEGLIVDENITFADLRGTLLEFIKQMFGEDREIRLRPSYFPFTEPSAEVDVSCLFCNGVGCRLCKHTGWIEILGSGMVHPHVLEMAGYDSEKVTGFAFGVGIDRIAMLKYGIDDMRLLFENDIRFLEQF